MAAVLEAARETATSSKASRMPKQLAAYAFKPGHAPVNGGGRPLGSKSFSTILIEAAPKLGKVYLREALKGSAPLLLDTRKVFMPIDSDAPASSTATVLVGWLEQRLNAPTLRMPITDAAVAMPQPDAPTLPPSASSVNVL